VSPEIGFLTKENEGSVWFDPGREVTQKKKPENEAREKEAKEKKAREKKADIVIAGMINKKEAEEEAREIKRAEDIEAARALKRDRPFGLKIMATQNEQELQENRSRLGLFADPGRQERIKKAQEERLRGRGREFWEIMNVQDNVQDRDRSRLGRYDLPERQERIEQAREQRSKEREDEIRVTDNAGQQEVVVKIIGEIRADGEVETHFQQMNSLSRWQQQNRRV
jgi:hypothetical protein